MVHSRCLSDALSPSLIRPHTCDTSKAAEGFRGRVTQPMDGRQPWDLSQAGQNTQSQNMGMYKECSEHSGRQPGGHCAQMWMSQRLQSPPGPLTCRAFTLCVEMCRNSFIWPDICVIFQKRSCDFTS